MCGGFSSSVEDVYRRSRVALRGLDRVVLVSEGGMNIAGSSCAGLRRRAIVVFWSEQQCA